MTRATPLSRKDLLSIRTDAAHLAASFFVDCVPSTGELWKLARFFEQTMLHGTDGTRAEFGPKPAEKPGLVVAWSAPAACSGDAQ